MKLSIEMPEEETGAGPHTTVLEGAPAPAQEVAAADDPTAPETPPVSRPSLDVAIENLFHLRPRVDALCLRLAGWDTRSLGMGTQAAFAETVASVDKSLHDLEQMLVVLKGLGYVAHATPLTRKLARLHPGTLVKLLDPAPWAEIYTAEELASIRVEAVAGKRAFLKTCDRDLGLVEISKLEVRT